MTDSISEMTSAMNASPTVVGKTNGEETQSTVHTKEEFYLDPFYEIQRKINLLLRYGELLMENGANSTHIARDLQRGGLYMGIPSEFLHIYISYHTIMINVNGNNKSFTAFTKVDRHLVNMNSLSGLSKLSWRALEHRYSLDDFEEELYRLSHLSRLYPPWLTKLAVCVGSGSLTILFGGSLLSAMVTMLATLLGMLGNETCQKLRFNVYVGFAVSALIATMTTGAFYMFFPSKEAFLFAVISCTLFMIPGVPLINAIDDVLNGNIVSGMTRFVHAFLIVASMTFGIALGIYFFPVQNFTNINVFPQHFSIVPLMAAFVAAFSFAIFFNTPKRLLLFIGLGGFLALTIRNTLLLEFGLFAPGAAFMGAAIIGIVMGQVAKRVDTSPLILAIPSAVPLIPGIFFYRFLFAIIEVDHLSPKTLVTAIQNGTIAMLIIFSVAVGVTVSSMFGQAFVDKKKQRKVEHFLELRNKTTNP